MGINNLPGSISAMVQNGVLERTFFDALYPALKYRQQFEPLSVPVHIGQSMTFTKSALLTATTVPLSPITDTDFDSSMSPVTPGIEQYSLTMNQYGRTVDTNLLSSATALASNYLRNVEQLALHAGRSLDMRARNALYDAYLAGNSRVNTASGPLTTITVDDVRGFQTQLVNGVQLPVSALNALPVTMPLSTPTSNTVVGVTPGPVQPNGQIPGTLTLGVASTVLVDDPVLAFNRSFIFRIGGGGTANDVTSANTLTLQSIIDSAAHLRTLAVPTFEDGKYHCVLSPTSMAQLLGDPGFRQLYTSLPESEAYRTGSVGDISGVRFFESQNAPTLTGAGTAKVHMPIIMGEEVGIEGRYEAMQDWLAEVNSGANGAVIYNPELEVSMITRAPLDKLQQVVASSWSFIGDWTIPTDALSDVGGSQSTYKRAVIIQHGSLS